MQEIHLSKRLTELENLIEFCISIKLMQSPTRSTGTDVTKLFIGLDNIMLKSITKN